MKKRLFLIIFITLLVMGCEDTRLHEIEPNLIVKISYSMADSEKVEAITISDTRHLINPRYDRYRMKKIYYKENAVLNSVSGQTLKIVSCANMSVLTNETVDQIKLECEVYEFIRFNNQTYTAYYNGYYQNVAIYKPGIDKIFQLISSASNNNSETNNSNLNEFTFQILDKHVISLSEEYVRKEDVVFQKPINTP